MHVTPSCRSKHHTAKDRAVLQNIEFWLFAYSGKPEIDGEVLGWHRSFLLRPEIEKEGKATGLLLCLSKKVVVYILEATTPVLFNLLRDLQDTNTNTLFKNTR